MVLTFLTGTSELYTVPAGAAESIQNHVIHTLISDVPRHVLWRHTEPAFAVQFYTLVESVGFNMNIRTSMERYSKRHSVVNH